MAFEALTGGLALAFNLQTILMTAIGVFFGLIIGVLPGLGPLMGIILLTPIAFYLPPVAGMALLVAVFVGGSCGGAISAILLRIPGTPLAAATLLDGYPMSQRGLTAEAIGIAVVASSLGGLIGGVFLIFLSPMLAEVALRFAPPEYFALTLTGLITIAVVSGESTVKGLLVGIVGLLTATIGMDPFSSVYRFTFGMDQMLGGFHIVAIVVGLFALSEMFMQIEAGRLDLSPRVARVRASLKAGFRAMRHGVNLVRSSVIGTFFGALPGAGGVISAFTAYAVTKSVSRQPERFGTGIEDGVVTTESANNATCGGTLIPSLALAVPGDASSAVLIGALILLGFFPGPELFENNIDIVGGIFLSYVSANVFLLILGVAFTPVFASVLRIKKKYLIPVILMLSVIGTFAIQASVFDLWVMLGFGVIGYGLRKFDYPLAPLVIGAVLGPICESNFRRSLIISGDDYAIFIERPLSATILAVNLLLLLWVVLPGRWKSRWTKPASVGG